MKVVFIQPRVGFKGHTWEALGIGYIISYLKKMRGDIGVEFYSGFYDSDETILNACKDANVIGIGCTSPQYKHGMELARQIKIKDNFIIFGGIHPTTLPNQVLKEECVDAVVSGEGESSFYFIIESLYNHYPVRKLNYSTQYLAELDNLPFPDRVTIKNERNIEQAYKDNGKRITSILSARGCPYQCGFCSSHSLWGRKVRYRSPLNILTEMETLVAHWDIDFIKFADDTFTVDKQRVLDFCRLKKSLGTNMAFGANAHVNTVDKETIEELAKANCKELWFGVESGSPRILDDMHKHTKVESIKDIFKIVKANGMRTRAYFLLGMPNETLEDIEMTEKLCDQLEPDEVGFTLLSPYPCNEYYDPELMKDWDWSSFDEYNNDWVRTKTLTNAELKTIQKRLVGKYQDRIAYRQKVKR